MKIKHNKPEQFQESDNLPPWLESAKRETNGLRVPDGYFDLLSPAIIDRIKEQENKSLLKSHSTVYMKPVVWAPVLATSVAVVLLMFIIPAENKETITETDEWTEINIAYDASYAEEVLLAESYNIDYELENNNIGDNESNTTKGVIELTDDEITEYLKDQEIDLELITDK